MFWLAKPPYLRWAAMGVVLVAAFAVDLRDQRTERRPFAARDIALGEQVDGAVEWKDVLAGRWEPVDTAGLVATTAIRRGEPIVASMLSSWSPPPDDWWSVEVDLPDSATVGRTARVAVTEPLLTVDGIVVAVADGGAFGASATGLVAIPPDSADAVARASALGRVSVLLGPPAGE